MNIKNIYNKLFGSKYPDPLKECKLARNCSHVDGFLCPCDEMNNTDNVSENNESIQYQIERAKQYISDNSSKDGSEDTLAVCIISDLLREIRRLNK